MLLLPKLVWLSLSTVLGCGVSVHQALLKRLDLPQNVTERLEFARAGAFFPDAFYDCMDHSDAAEEAHWPPFLAEGMQLVREKQVAGDVDGSLNLYAFLVGVLSHQVADVTWHSLGIQQGLLQVMARTEFDTEQDAHSTLDVGGDFILLKRLFQSDYKWIQDPWDYDKQDIQTIFSRMGFDVSSFSVSYCMNRGRAALSAEIKIADPAYIHYAQKSPLLYGDLESYFAGGMAEMHTTTQECLGALAQLDGDSWDICQVFDGKRPPNKRSNGRTRARAQRVFKSVASYSHVKAPQIKSHENMTASGAEYSHFGQAVVWWENMWVVSAPVVGQLSFFSPGFELLRTIQGPQKLPGLYHSRFGAALVGLVIKQQPYLAVSSPGLSRLDFFLPNGTHSGAVEWNAQRTFGQTGRKLVGTSLLWDENTLYVGAPYSDEDGNSQSGAVFVLDKYSLEHAINSTTTIDPPRLAHDAVEFEQFGKTLAVSNMFVLAGSPGQSAVYGFDRLTHGRLLVLSGPDKSAFGGGMLATSGNKIMVGAPLDTPNGEQSGSVYTYEYTRRKQVEGLGAYDRFGHSGVWAGAKGRGKMLVGSPFSGTLYNDTSVLASEGDGFADVLATNGTWVAVGSPWNAKVAWLPLDSD